MLRASLSETSGSVILCERTKEQIKTNHIGKQYPNCLGSSANRTHLRPVMKCFVCKKPGQGIRLRVAAREDYTRAKVQVL